MNAVRTALVATAVALTVPAAALAGPAAALTTGPTHASVSRQARPTWSSAASGIAGVEASGTSSRTGPNVHLVGSLRDTTFDGWTAQLDVKVDGDVPHIRRFVNRNSLARPTTVDVVSHRAKHVWVREVTMNAKNEDKIKVGSWHRLY